MMGKTSMATAVRDPDGEVQVEAKRIKKGKHLSMALKIPFVRGTVNLVLSLIRGTKTLLRSAAVYGEDEEEEPGKIQKWLAEKCKVNLMDVISVISPKALEYYRMAADEGYLPSVSRIRELEPLTQ